MKGLKNKRSVGFLLLAAGCLVLSAVITGVMLYQWHRTRHNELKDLMTSQADVMTASVNQALLQVYGLEALVLGAGGGSIDLAADGPYLIRNEYSKYIRNVLLAPGGVVTQVYPLKGNESVIGLDLYSRANASYKDALKAKETGKIVVTGPFNLVQGGQAISARLLVKIPQTDGTTKDWGLVSVTLDFPQVMQDTGTNLLEEQGYAYRVLKKNSATGVYDQVFSQNYQDQTDKEAVDFSIYGMDFKIEAYPVAGWVNLPKWILTFIAVFLVLMAAGILIRSLVHYVDSLKIYAIEDALTGLLNRAAGEWQINRALREKDFVKGTFILMDIDYFKHVNDTLGHQSGDRVLVTAARSFKKIFREEDILCRLGGDEFVIFMRIRDNQEGIKEKLDQLLAVMSCEVTCEGKTVTISASIGATFAPEHGTTFKALYAKADKALYISKEKGRNCATFYHEFNETEDSADKTGN